MEVIGYVVCFYSNVLTYMNRSRSSIFFFFLLEGGGGEGDTGADRKKKKKKVKEGPQFPVDQADKQQQYIISCSGQNLFTRGRGKIHPRNAKKIEPWKMKKEPLKILILHRLQCNTILFNVADLDF